MNLPKGLIMYSLFNSPIIFNPVLNKVSGWNESRRLILDEMNRLAQFYHNTAEWSKNQNVLNRILSIVDITPNPDKDYVAELARNEIEDKIATLGIFSPEITSKVQPEPQFYNTGNLEVLIYDGSYFDANKAKAYWRHLEPVKILEHPFDDLNFGLPNFNYRSEINRNGIVIISINVAMLIVQYHYWIESLEEISDDLLTTAAKFIMRYPLFNAMKSQTDIAIRNRLFRLYNNEPVCKFLKSHSVMLRDPTRLVDNSLRNVCNTLRSKSLTYSEVLSQIPAVSYENQLQVMRLPTIPATRPVKWALDLTRIRTIRNLLLYEENLPNGSGSPLALTTSNTPRNLATRAFIKRKLYNMENQQQVPIPLDVDTRALLQEVRLLLK